MYIQLSATIPAQVMLYIEEEDFPFDAELIMEEAECAGATVYREPAGHTAFLIGWPEGQESVLSESKLREILAERNREYAATN